MSEYIKLDAGAISSKDLRKAKTALNKAIYAMNEAENALANSWYKYNSAGASVFFGDDIKKNAGTIGRSLEDFKKKLDKYAGLLDSGPEEITEADRDFKGQKSNAWQRTIIAIGGGIGGLFKHGGRNTANDPVTIESEKGTESHNPQNNTSSTTSGKVVVNNYSDGVNQGQIRHVNQNDPSNGWYKGDNGYPGGGECGYSSQSMALSYLGKDVSPYELCEEEYAWYENKKRGYGTIYGPSNGIDGTYGIGGVKCTDDTPEWGVTSGSNAMKTIDNMIERFLKDGGKGEVSPVVIHYSDGRREHSVILIGKNPDGTYQAICPSRGSEPVNLAISANGEVTDSVWGDENHYCSIDRVQQYELSK